MMAVETNNNSESINQQSRQSLYINATHTSNFTHTLPGMHWAGPVLLIYVVPVLKNEAKTMAVGVKYQTEQMITSY